MRKIASKLIMYLCILTSLLALDTEIILGTKYNIPINVINVNLPVFD